MLNPFAHEYTPASSFPPEEHTSAPRKNSQPKKQQPKKKKTDKPKPTVKPETSKPKKTDNTKPNETPKAKKNDNAKPNDASKTKRNDNASKKSSKEPQQTHNKARRKSSHHNTQMTPSAPLDQFEKESKFITIEAAIDPIRRIDTNNNATSSSSAVDKTLFEHGYEKYIDWVTYCDNGLIRGLTVCRLAGR